MLTMSESINELALALSKAQAEFKLVGKSKAGYNFNYANLADITEMIKPVLEKYELSYSQFPVSNDNKIGVLTIIMHSSGQFMQSSVEANIPALKGQSEIQCIGSAITYLRRYALAGALGVAQEEDAIIEAMEYKAQIESEEEKTKELLAEISVAADEVACKELLKEAWNCVKSVQLREEIKAAYDAKKSELGFE